MGVLCAFLLGGVVGAGLVLARRAGRRTPLPFGPFLVAGAWIGILSGDLVLRGGAG